ncbi:hypothetical protein KGQ19_07545 [Catenulispora sp. NL8]|uniref:DUF4328 domain-containing protein n=2 Tax=Catenulispora pinistramenti TaxID=2705254 RepID=A0ABS5KKZ9_9ACTN|nr:hypothetical protein [Catenulispora pinistramenti]MBS2546718.1 hypothetical protein [Catenulispora pinistramenti]
MDGALKVFVGGTVVANTVVFGARAVLYALSYLAVGDLQNGDLTAIDKINTYHTWMTIDWWATVVSAFVLVRLQHRWVNAGNANALTRPDVGLSWFRTAPSSKTFQRWQWAQLFGYLSIIFLNIAFRNAASNDGQLRAWAVLEVMLCSVVIAASIGTTVEARRMTAELLERVDFSEQAARTARVTEPDPIA